EVRPGGELPNERREQEGTRCPCPSPPFAAKYPDWCLQSRATSSRLGARTRCGSDGGRDGVPLGQGPAHLATFLARFLPPSPRDAPQTPRIGSALQREAPR